MGLIALFPFVQQPRSNPQFNFDLADAFAADAQRPQCFLFNRNGVSYVRFGVAILGGKLNMGGLAEKQ